MSNVNEVAHTDSWKSLIVFEKQLELNKYELAGHYPAHWYSFLDCLSDISPIKSMLDVGCGCGALYQLCQIHFPAMQYIGLDYSQEGIQIAKIAWPNGIFYCWDYKDLSKQQVANFELVHLGGLLDGLPNGDEALAFILGLNIPKLLIGRVAFTDEESFAYTSIAYNTTFFRYKHNKKLFFEQIALHNYQYRIYNESIYLFK